MVLFCLHCEGLSAQGDRQQLYVSTAEMGGREGEREGGREGGRERGREGEGGMIIVCSMYDICN